MQIEALPLQGAYVITLPFTTDHRGSFTKTFHDANLRAAGINFQLKESYYSFSKAGVIRGMHFQIPPHQHSKVVFCPTGAILDVIVDLRADSATYGQCYATVLSADNHKAYFIPEGFAHGFKALTDDAMTYYLVSSEYSKDHDTGILYNSLDFDWELDDPIISARDLSFPLLADFNSPFHMQAL